MALIDILRGIPLFKNLDNEDLSLIAARLRKEVYAKGQIVFREGDAGHKMYLVESGQLAVVGQEGGQAIAFMGPGSFFGEISLLLAEPRTATLQVTIDAQLWALDKDDFEVLVTARSSIASEMLQEIGRRLVQTTQRGPRITPRRITAVWGDNGQNLAAAIYQQLKTPVGLIPLTGAKFQRGGDLQTEIMVLDNQELTETSLAENLSYQVEVFKHILLLLPHQPDPVARKAINLADTVVSLGPPPAWLKGTVHKQNLWIGNADQNDLARLARRLTNRTIGLAMSSGGARGLAHVGVLKVLIEENIPIDMIAGTSAGALFGALYAAGWNYQEILDYSLNLKKLTNLVNWDFNFLPTTGLVKGRRAYKKFLARPLNNLAFADLIIPLYIVAVDIITGDEVILDSGSLADAVRASTGTAVIADPWYYQNRYLLDGGLVNPLPADILRDQGADIIIASSVIRPLGESYQGPTDKLPNFRQIIFNMSSAVESEIVKTQLPLIDVLIQHDVRVKFTFDFEKLEETIAHGEQATRRMLPDIKKAVGLPL